MSNLTFGIYEKYGVSYKTMTLTDGEYALTITPEKGGMATSFTKNGEEYLWLRDKNYESTDRPRCGVPILFPNCGKPDGGVHHFAGADYPMEVHGFADLLRQGNLDENTRMMAAEYIYSEGHRLERLSFKLLDLLLLKKDGVTMKRVWLSTYLAEVEKALSPTLQSKGMCQGLSPRYH